MGTVFLNSSTTLLGCDRLPIAQQIPEWHVTSRSALGQILLEQCTCSRLLTMSLFGKLMLYRKTVKQRATVLLSPRLWQ